MARKSSVAEDASGRNSIAPQPANKKKRKPKRSARSDESSEAYLLQVEDPGENDSSLSVRLLSTAAAQEAQEAQEISEPEWEMIDAPADEDSSSGEQALVPAHKPKKKKATKARVIVTTKGHKTRSLKKTHNRKTAEHASEEKSLKHDLFGLMLFAFGLLSGLSLLTHDQAAITSMDISQGATQNWIGPFGANLAEALVLGFGFVAYGVPLAFMYLGVLWLRRAFRRPPGRRIVGWALIGIGTTCFLETAFGDSANAAFPPGGVLGLLQATALLPYLYPIGTGILSVLVVSTGVLIALERSLSEGIAVAASHLERLFYQYRDQIELRLEERRILREEAESLKEELKEELGAETEQQENDDKKETRKREKEERKKRIRDTASENVRDKLVQELKDKAEQKSVISQVPTIVSAKTETAQPENMNLKIELKEPAWVQSVNEIESVIHDIGSVVIDEEKRNEAQSENKVNHTQLQITKKESESAPSGNLNPEGEESLCIVEREFEKRENWDTGRPALATESPFSLPPLSMLDYDAPIIEPVAPEKMMEMAERLTQKFADFGIEGTMREVRPGPVVTTFEFSPAPGIKVSRIAALADDIAMAMEAVHVRIVAPIPGKGAVGIEIPNESRETVYLKEIIASDSFSENSDKKLLMALGKDIQGTAYHADLAEMPHVLISGTTGSGKSVSVNAMICSILYRATPSEVKFLMIDPKMLELSIYEGIPHLLLPPIVDSKKAANALQWAVGEMERRYQVMSEMGVRDILGYNEVLKQIKEGRDPQQRKDPKDAQGKPIGKFPYIVVVIDEYADLLATAGKEVESHVMRLAQKARACGIHVMLATQRPSVDVITGVIKANFPVRMGFRLASVHDSKTIINRKGAEKLLGRGDMLIMPAGTSNVTRVHGAYISEKELFRVVEYLKKQGKPDYNLAIVEAPPDEEGELGFSKNEEKDKKFDLAIDVVARSRKCSTSWLQRQLGVGYNRAARMVEMMEREGIVGPALNAKGAREIYVRSGESHAEDNV